MTKENRAPRRVNSARGGGLERHLHYRGAVGVENLEALPPREALGRPVDGGREGAVGHELPSDKGVRREACGPRG